MKVSGTSFEVDGWAALARALSLARGWVKFVSAPVDLMKEGRREDLRKVWESLDNGHRNGWGVRIGNDNQPFFKHSVEWRSIEELLDRN